MSETDRTISYSQYTKWAKCPLSWKLEYIDKHKIKDDSIDVVFGTAMHETIQEWLVLKYGATPKKADLFDMDGIFQSKFMGGIKERLLTNPDAKKPTKEVAIEYYVHGTSILDHVRRYLKDWCEPSWELVGVEIPLERQYSETVKFIGYIDLVFLDKKKNMVHIFDLKTSKRGWNEYAKKDVSKTDQLLIYKKFYSEQFDVPQENIIVKFIILKRTLPVIENGHFVIKHVAKFEPVHGKIKMKAATERLNEFVNAVVDKNYVHAPNPSKNTCKFCKFATRKDLCSVGVED